jgi:hypothetical protein
MTTGVTYGLSVADHPDWEFGKPVNIVGMYPIYAGEADWIRKVGLKEFWHMPGYDMYDVKRPDLSK